MPTAFKKNILESIKMEEKSYEMSFGQLLRILLKRWWMILIAIVVGIGVAFCYVNYFVTPTYNTYAKVGVNSYEMSSYQEFIAGQSLSKECASILVSNITLERAANSLNAYDFAENGGKPYRNYTADVLLSMIKTETSEDTRYFNVRVTSIYPEETRIVADAVTKSFCEVLEEEDIIKGGEGKIIHRPVTPSSPSSPNVAVTLVLGAIIGAVIMVAILVVIHICKDALDSEDWLVETYREKIPLLAVIPDINQQNKGYYKKYYKRSKY